MYVTNIIFNYFSFFFLVKDHARVLHFCPLSYFFPLKKRAFAIYTAEQVNDDAVIQ